MKKTQHIFCAMKPMTALAFCFNHECICKFMYLFDSFGCDRIRLSVADNCHRAYVEKNSESLKRELQFFLSPIEPMRFYRWVLLSSSSPLNPSHKWLLSEAHDKARAAHFSAPS